MSQTIRVKASLSRFQAKLFAMCGLNVLRLFWMFFIILFCEQLLSISIQYAIWGERFPHIGDTIFIGVWFATFIYYANQMGEFLLKLHTDSD